MADVDRLTLEALMLGVEPPPGLEELLQRPRWHARAACRGQGTAAWFPERGDSTGPAKAVCASCPVQAECLADALDVPPAHDAGVWGGTSPQVRRRLRKGRAA